LGEVTAIDGSIAVTLAAHQAIGLKVWLYYYICSIFWVPTATGVWHLMIGYAWHVYTKQQYGNPVFKNKSHVICHHTSSKIHFYLLLLDLIQT
jgi:hypothetical protein